VRRGEEAYDARAGGPNRKLVLKTTFDPLENFSLRRLSNPFSAASEVDARSFCPQARPRVQSLLFGATIVALAWANSPWSASYFALWKLPLQIGRRPLLSMDLHHWIDDGLMVLFFLVVGLEIKREIVKGELSSFRQAALPIIAAQEAL